MKDKICGTKVKISQYILMLHIQKQMTRFLAIYVQNRYFFGHECYSDMHN